jgi:protease PrsW
MTDASRPPRWKQSLSRASRSQGFLWRFALGMILAGAAIGYVVSKVGSATTGKFRQRVLAKTGLSLEDPDSKRKRRTDSAPRVGADTNLAAAAITAFAEELGSPSVNFPQILRTLGRLAPYLEKSDHEQLRPILLRRFTATEVDLAIDFVAACDVADRAAYERLRGTADSADAPRFARYAFGRIEMDREHYADAYNYFRKEGERPEAYESRWMAIVSLREAKEYATLAKLQAEPRYAELFTTSTRLDVAIGNRDWRAIAKWVPITQIETFERGVLLMTLITGLAWGFFLVHLGELPRVFSTMALLCALGFLLGVLSTTATIYLVVLQDEILKFSATEDVVRILAYYIGGVGAREELCKLLLFVPLLPILIKRDDELEALIVASFVGLGFAVEENGGYFMMSEAASAPGRFLTANFFHVALTGMNGLALFRACTRGASGLNDFLFIFPVTVLAHGGYDAFFHLPQFDEGGYVSMVIFILFTAYYFRRAHELRNNVRMTIGLTGSFVFGMSLLAAAMTVYQIVNLGADAGTTLIVTEILGSAILLFMFFRVFNEPLFP